MDCRHCENGGHRLWSDGTHDPGGGRKDLGVGNGLQDRRGGKGVALGGYGPRAVGCRRCRLLTDKVVNEEGIRCRVSYWNAVASGVSERGEEHLLWRCLSRLATRRLVGSVSGGLMMWWWVEGGVARMSRVVIGCWERVGCLCLN